VLLVDDIATDGRSKIELASALRAMEARVDHVLVMFFYDVFVEARSLLTDLRIRLHYLATWRDVVAEAGKSGFLPAAAVEDVRRFIDNPARWSLDHGGIGAFPHA
jgi:orotate phosphoribosyltransferase